MRQSYSFIMALIAGLLLIGLTGCSSNQEPATSIAPTETMPPAASSTDSPTSTSLPEIEIETPQPPQARRSQYVLTAVVNYDQHRVVVDEQIRYINQTGQSLNSLVLMVDSLYYPGVFKLNGIAIEGGQGAINYTQESGWLSFPLETPLAPSASITINLSFELNLPSPQPSAVTRPVPFGYTDRQTNLVDWYPFVPPYQEGKGWVANRAGYFGEYLVYEQADFEIHLKIESSLANLTVAASSPASLDDQGWRHYHHDQARNFVFSISPDYQVVSTRVGAVEVISYAFSFHDSASQAALDATAKALALFSEYYSPYSRPVLSVVEADFLDGMEYDGLYFLSNGFYNLYKGSPADYLTAIAVHETAHQWFYVLLANDQANEPWLDEAFCTYQERLFFERYYPEALDWWWGYRVNYYNPQGWVNGSIYNPQGYRAYRDAVYLNGAIFFEELRQLIGPEIFANLMKNYVTQYSGEIVTGQDFFQMLSQYTLQDITSLKGKYFQVLP